MPHFVGLWLDGCCEEKRDDLLPTQRKSVRERDWTIAPTTNDQRCVCTERTQSGVQINGESAIMVAWGGRFSVVMYVVLRGFCTAYERHDNALID